MNKCNLCGATFSSHTALSEHIFDAHGNNVNWNSRTDDTRGGGGPRGIIAIVVGIIIAASLFVSPAAKAQDAQPQPTPSVGEPPHAIEMHRVYLPWISFPAEVHGCDDCQAVSWRPTGS